MFSFAATKDEEYLALLKIAKVSDNLSYSSSQLSNIVNSLNRLKKYKILHKRVIPLLKMKAKKLDVFHLLDANIQQILNDETQKGVVTGLAQKCQLVNVINVLSAVNIPIILLKGSAFSGSLYQVNAPRTSNDIDVLVKKVDWQQAKKIISTIMEPLTIKHKQVFDNLYETSFIPKGKVGAAVDVHKSLIHPLLFRINEDQLWEGSVKHQSFNNELVRVLSPEHALIHQAIHAYKDMDFSKYNLVDSHEIITVLKPDITKTVVKAKEWGVNIALFTLLNNCSEVMGSDIDSDLVKQIKPNLIVRKVMISLIKSKYSQPIGNKKNFRYRLNQIISQFIFSGSIVRPLALQWLFVKSRLTTSKNVND